MIPVVAIVGRPNVGKSTLFNRLTRSRDALVASLPGLTRDRQYGEVSYKNQSFILVDTGGISGEEEGIDKLMAGQSHQAMLEADIVLFIVDAKSGLLPDDKTIADQIRRLSKPCLLIANKTDNIDPNIALADFYQLGFSKTLGIAAAHGRGVQELLASLVIALPGSQPDEIEQPEQEQKTDTGIKVAIIGRPNVGKSTLVNRILGEERVVVFDQAGTTRDSIYIPFTRFDEKYTIIDTAGVRKRGKTKEKIEKFSIIKTLQAIEDAHVVVIIIDAQEGLVEQDLHLLGFVVESGRAVVLAINKWDHLDLDQKRKIRDTLKRRLVFIDYAKLHYISALHGTNVGHLFKSIQQAYKSAFIELSTNRATKILEKALEQHQLPLVQGRRIKLRYAHIGGHNPPTIVIHGNQTESIPQAYKRYLMGYYRKALKLIGTPVKLQFISSKNPYKPKK